MKLITSGLMTLFVVGLLPCLSPANPCFPGVPRAPDAIGPGYYACNEYGAVYGPNYVVVPPVLPFNGLLPIPQFFGKDKLPGGVARPDLPPGPFSVPGTAIYYKPRAPAYAARQPGLVPGQPIPYAPPARYAMPAQPAYPNPGMYSIPGMPGMPGPGASGPPSLPGPVSWYSVPSYPGVTGGAFQGSSAGVDPYSVLLCQASPGSDYAPSQAPQGGSTPGAPAPGPNPAAPGPPAWPYAPWLSYAYGLAGSYAPTPCPPMFAWQPVPCPQPCIPCFTTVIPRHPYIRSPRDFFMFGQTTND
jgi:hypothetical protein